LVNIRESWAFPLVECRSWPPPNENFFQSLQHHFAALIELGKAQGYHASRPDRRRL
jgi:hypothetical protein